MILKDVIMYGTGMLERTMSAPMRKSAVTVSSSEVRDYPRDAFNYHDDVTREGVAILRQKAADVMATDEWEVVDGFGLSHPA